MSVGSISSSPTVQPNTQQQDDFKQNFQQLAQALQSGNISVAQQAYATLSQNLPTPPAGAPSGQNNPFQQALSQIGTALQSGDLSSAQSAMQSLQKDMKAHRGHHPRGEAQDQNASGGDNTTALTSVSVVSSGSGSSFSVIV